MREGRKITKSKIDTPEKKHTHTNCSWGFNKLSAQRRFHEEKKNTHTTINKYKHTKSRKHIIEQRATLEMTKLRRFGYFLLLLLPHCAYSDFVFFLCVSSCGYYLLLSIKSRCSFLHTRVRPWHLLRQYKNI